MPEFGTLDHFILLQRANGSFLMNEELTKYSKYCLRIEILTKFRLTLDEIKNLKPPSIDNDMVWATAIAIHIMETQFNSSEEEWDLLSAKAKKFLLEQTSSHSVVSNIIRNAEKL